MQHDGSLPSHQRHNYRHVGDGMLRMAREEGIGAYMRGWLPNCTRAATQTAGQLASYDIIKGCIINYSQTDETPAVQALSAFLAAVVAVTITNPLDVVKTRVMSSMSTAGTGMAVTAREAFRAEGGDRRSTSGRRSLMMSSNHRILSRAAETKLATISEHSTIS
ncbi:Mitochondrial dicarboxylate transporter [Fusarium odoratissimum]|uniref:Mitochondrial dicarboxylate transporter n=1 Tax=Fusarium oxysporum f. sp. cubense (strain race 4) TaxID=2502994 RepID=N1RTR0_FUSC4|nr:Mitochondrial dicarboxylate transporter [Fusarium odoratissimum]